MLPELGEMFSPLMQLCEARVYRCTSGKPNTWKPCNQISTTNNWNAISKREKRVGGDANPGV